MPNGEEGEHDLPRGDKRISCLTEWESFSCATTKPSQTALFFEGTAVFVIRVQHRCCLCFTWTSPSVLTTWTLPACVLTGKPPRTQTGGRSVNLRWEVEERCTAFLSKGRGEEEPAWKIYRSQVCTSAAESSQADKNRFTYSAICGQKKSVKGKWPRQAWGTSPWLTAGGVLAFASDWLIDMFKNCPIPLPSLTKKYCVFKKNKWLQPQIMQIFSGNTALSC